LSIGAVLLLTVAILGAAVHARTQRVVLSDDGCPVSRAVPSRRSIVLIVDQSDRFEAGDRQTVRLEAKRWFEQSQLYDRISVVLPNAQEPFEPRMLFHGCAPLSSRDASIFTSTPRKLDEKWEEFRKKLDDAIESGLRVESQPQSPLMETLVAVANDGEIGATDKVIVIFFSDMLQKSRFRGRKLSFYPPARLPDVDGARMKEFEQYLGSFSFEKLSIQVHRAARRDQSRIRDDVKRFWEAWLKRHGASFEWSR
jgi:hypothetical protein